MTTDQHCFFVNYKWCADDKLSVRSVSMVYILSQRFPFRSTRASPSRSAHSVFIPASPTYRLSATMTARLKKAPLITIHCSIFSYRKECATQPANRFLFQQSFL